MMKRIAVLMTMIACAASPAVAQWQGMPAWNNPKGGTGVTLNGDVGVPNADAGKGTAFGARATLGLANISFTAGIASWKPKDAGASSTSVGGVAQFRVIGGWQHLQRHQHQYRDRSQDDPPPHRCRPECERADAGTQHRAVSVCFEPLAQAVGLLHRVEYRLGVGREHRLRDGGSTCRL